MKNILIFLILFTSDIYCQIESFGKINGQPKKYKETFFEANNVKNRYTKGKYLYDDIYVKDSNNIFIKQSIFAEDKMELSKDVYKNKLKIETINYDESGKIVNKTKFKYNLQDIIIEEDFYYSSDTLISKTNFEYDNNLLILKTIIEYNLGSNGRISKVNYTYDLKNNLTSMYYVNDDQDIFDKFVYNNKNYLIEFYSKSSFPNRNQKLQLCNKINYLEYDNFNWTKIFLEEGICRDDGKSNIYYIERKFEY